MNSRGCGWQHWRWLLVARCPPFPSLWFPLPQTFHLSSQPTLTHTNQPHHAHYLQLKTNMLFFFLGRNLELHFANSWSLPIKSLSVVVFMSLRSYAVSVLYLQLSAPKWRNNRLHACRAPLAPAYTSHLHLQTLDTNQILFNSSAFLTTYFKYFRRKVLLLHIHKWGNRYKGNWEGRGTEWKDKWSQNQPLVPRLTTTEVSDWCCMQQVESTGLQAWAQVITQDSKPQCTAFRSRIKN